ncbi:MAG: hypothetical protein P4N59_18085 [Negativicutes bacterium]|nr:hypothetical protein [Negativicutes bacterium]
MTPDDKTTTAAERFPAVFSLLPGGPWLWIGSAVFIIILLLFFPLLFLTGLILLLLWFFA